MAERLAIFSIDVEPDSTGASWNYAEPLGFDGIRAGIEDTLQPLFATVGARPTYLLNNVVMDYGPWERIRALEDCELGTHLHPDFVDPERVHEEPSGKRGAGNACFLDPEIETQKLQHITDRFNALFGRRPTSYRAGRFGVRPHTLRVLSDLGYVVDSSVTPGVLWGGEARLGRIDFRKAPLAPYWPSDDDLAMTSATPAVDSVMEIPVTILRRFGRQPVWLRPGFSFSPDTFVDELLRRSVSSMPIVANCMFHNVDVVAGLSPHCKNVERETQIRSQLRELLAVLHDRDFKFVTLTEAAHVCRRSR